ncbi:aminopeptidase P family protein [Lacrimispora sphenoides]|uniref:Xaa-Pro aminopeptidase n=1 Tax=Lacrimispora sphenoides JCM 1415 TaxID=1297793 RepID=A0ABY1CAE6_9FIRM|nr:aminopeptidase P family protein [Lacrimispora sphenoides]SET85860.1 Xaa-Pro aminopeptidase [[Clostridium] sphenoides JCM 1415]SUY51833.1 creatinase [Lacrimispora sphenoides]
MIQERLEQLRKLMAEHHMDAYMIPTSDFHESEYVGEYFKCREFITGFSGSAGTAVITKDEAGLWTDGRYFVQAGKQLEGTGITLERMGQPGVPEIGEYLDQVLPEGGCLGFDGRVVNCQLGQDLEKLLAEKHVTLAYQEDLVDVLWKERPKQSAEPVWILEEKYSGKTSALKIEELRSQMKKEKATIHILTTLDDIAWLLNIRGNDVECNPVVLSYAMITLDRFYLFINEKVLKAEVKAYFKDLSVTICPYNDIYTVVSQLRDQKVLVETGKTNYAIVKNLDSSNSIIDKMNPTALSKAMKNPVEVENMRKAHIKDGVAMVKFIYWLKQNVGKETITEVSAQEHLDHLRSEQEGNLGLSFDTISAYGANAAMCHYKATAESDVKIEPRGLYLVDSGGQYYEGTTDVTRTIAVGPLTEKEREHFTLTVISMLRLGAVKFLYGCRGLTLDYVAREPFWSRGINYDHGTGHGVGYLLNVHERPNGIRWRMVPERQDNSVLEEGMITSDEPGVYIEGSHGVRTENLIVSKKAEENEYGQFMEFEFLTMVPIDLEAIDQSIMTEHDVKLLNNYHKAVYEALSPYVTGEEALWLKENTRTI